MATTADVREDNLRTLFPIFGRLEITFANKDVLLLVKNEGVKFYGFKQCDVFELCFGEYCEGGYSDEIPTIGKHHYMTTGLDYYPITELDIALNAFIERVRSTEPHKSSKSFPGKRLGEFLEVDPDQPSYGESIRRVAMQNKE